MGIELENQVIGILASALVISFVGLLLADYQVEHINLNVNKRDFQMEGCWSLAIVAYLAFASVVSVMRTQVISKLLCRTYILGSAFI